MKDYREFWIEEWNNGNWNSSTCWQNDLPAVNNLIHVIEYAAYEKLQQENAKLKQACEVMREALESYSCEIFCDSSGVDCELICLAPEKVKEIFK